MNEHFQAFSNYSPFLILTFGLGLALEYYFPLRAKTQNKTSRVVRNIAVTALGSIALKVLVFPISYSAARYTVSYDFGVIPHMGIGRVPRILLSLLLLDYTLYIWHRMTHEWRFLWRFHQVHHVDLDMDISTGMRFHWGELAFSVLYRSVLILLFGISPQTLVFYEFVNTVFVQFHHGNLKLPEKFERYLSYVIMTPRMHSIHHSLVQQETDSNYSTILSVWDLLHGTRIYGIPTNEIQIGVPSYRSEKEVGFFKLQWLPFQRVRSWALPDGSVPERNPRRLGLT